MNTHAPAKADQPAMPPGLRTLWAEANTWVDWLLGLFNRNTLRTTGVSRESGARLGIWLRDIESAVRRLILAAALAFTPPALTQSRAARTRTQSQATHRSFRIFRLRCDRQTAAQPRSHPPAPPQPYGHIRFRADPLLALGPARHAQLARSIAPRARNPLDRWVRPSRDDPDWRAPEETRTRQADEADDDYAQYIIAPQSAPGLTHSHNSPASSLADWRRRHDEWRKAIPAPSLAARLDALQRIAANPAAAIARTAHRLRHAQGLALRLARDALPRERPPDRAAHIATAGHTFDFAERTHATLVVPDTS